jgi:hypothetical protein
MQLSFLLRKNIPAAGPLPVGYFKPGLLRRIEARAEDVPPSQNSR